jgi:GT2 family glycosyltransferase
MTGLASGAPVTSVILCTFNQAGLLRRALRALASQSVPGDAFEVVLVDDGSTDDTAAAGREGARVLPNLHFLSTDRNVGLGSACNLGVQAARGEHLLFLDTDCIPQEDWIERMTRALRDRPLIAGAVRDPGGSYWVTAHNIAQFHPFFPGRPAGPVRFVAGANMGIRRTLLRELGGFEEGRRTAPDMELILRAARHGYRPWFEPEAVITHAPEKRSSLSDVLRYAADHAGQTITLRHLHRDVLDLPVTLRSAWLLRFLAPWIAAAVTLRIFAGNPRLWRSLPVAPVVFANKLAWCWGAAATLRAAPAARPGRQR